MRDRLPAAVDEQLRRRAGTFNRRWARRRVWAGIHRDVYVDHTGPPTWFQRAWPAVLLREPAALDAHPPSTSGRRRAATMGAVTVDDPNADERPSHVAWLVESAFVLGMAGLVAAGVGANMAHVFGYCSPVPAGEAPDCEGPDRLGGALTLLLPTVMLFSALLVHLRLKAVPSEGPRIRHLATGLGVALLVGQVLAYWTLFVPPAETPPIFLWWTLATVGAVLITGFAPRAVAFAAGVAAVALCVLAVRAELAAVVFSGGAGGLAVLACLAMWEERHWARRETAGVRTRPGPKPTA